MRFVLTILVIAVSVSEASGGDKARQLDYPTVKENGEFVIRSSTPIEGKLDRGARFWNDPASFRPEEMEDGTVVIHYVKTNGNGGGVFLNGIRKEQVKVVFYANGVLEEKPVVEENKEGVKYLPPVYSTDPAATHKFYAGHFYLEIKPKK